ncbi:MAG: hypothetical protein E7180_05670 [Erysipelotrichaceae bacterium]|nr:hypothetical protein [Erysipelotrichaceae bacterium]
MKMYIGYSIGDFDFDGKADFVMSAIIVRSNEKIDTFYKFIENEIDKLNISQNKKNEIKTTLSFNSLEENSKKIITTIFKENVKKRFRGIKYVSLKKEFTKENFNEIMFDSLIALYNNSYDILDIYVYFPNEIEYSLFEEKFTKSNFVNLNQVIKNYSKGNKIASTLSFCLRKDQSGSYLKENKVSLPLKV